MNKSRKEYPILKKISNFYPPYLPRICVIIILRQTEKEELDQVRSRYRGETNTRGKEVHFLRVNATKYIYIFIHGGGRSCLYIA